MLNSDNQVRNDGRLKFAVISNIQSRATGPRYGRIKRMTGQRYGHVKRTIGPRYGHLKRATPPRSGRAFYATIPWSNRVRLNVRNPCKL